MFAQGPQGMVMATYALLPFAHGGDDMDDDDDDDEYKKDNHGGFLR